MLYEYRTNVHAQARTNIHHALAQTNTPTHTQTHNHSIICFLGNFCAFVKYYTEHAAQRAKFALQGSKFNGVPCKVCSALCARLCCVLKVILWESTLRIVFVQLIRAEHSGVVVSGVDICGRSKCICVHTYVGCSTNFTC